jgi:hypothetical protein
LSQVRTTRTRRLSEPRSGRLILAKMLDTCFSTAPPVITKASAIAAFAAALGHQSEHMRSGGVSAAGGSARRATSSWATTSGPAPSRLL